MILEDIAQVIYAPVNAFKKIIENPKYLAALIIFLLFIGLMMGYEYTQFSRTYTEQTAPEIGNLPQYINATLWTGASNVSVTNNFDDYYNYTVYVPALAAEYSLFGNSSLGINATNANNVSAEISQVFNVDCSQNGFQNLSMTMKQVSPSDTVPQSAAITLVSLNNSSYTYDLTASLSNASAIGLWQNFTLTVGPSSQGWTQSGSPTWENITAIKLTLTYPTSTSINIEVGALLFHGQYETFSGAFGASPLYSFLEAFALQFLFGWFLLTGLIYLFFKGLKANVVWKPLFVGVVFAMIVMVVRAAVNLLAALTLPIVYYPYDLSLGVSSNPFGALYFPSGAVSTLSTSSQAAFNAINSATAGFMDVTTAMFLISYVWLGALCTIIVGQLKPEFSMMKRIVISAVSVGVTILLLALLVGLL